MTVPLEDYRWLVSDAAQPWLNAVRDSLTQLSAGTQAAASVALVSRLRKDLSAERAHLIIEQVELRKRARHKFSQAEQMFFTRQALEQATDEQIAQYKAARFSAGEPAADLCCGIGGDFVALARQAVAAGVDLDPIAALLAEANVHRLGIDSARCTVRTMDAMTFPVAKVSAWHIDPDRRAAGRRATRGELLEPALDDIHRLLQANRQAAIKLAPATAAPPAWRQEAELEWIGSRGECRQQVAWFGELARHPGLRAATVVDAPGGPRTIVGAGAEPAPVAGSLGNYLYEPHAAVRAARLVGAVCREHSLAAVSAGVAYLTADRLVADPALDAFEVRQLLPLDRRRLRAWCREQAIGCLEVKKRNVELDVEKLRTEIVGRGENEATLIIAPIGGNVRAIVARRVGRD